MKPRRTANFKRSGWVEVLRRSTSESPAFYDLGVIMRVDGDEIVYRSRDGVRKLASVWNATAVPSPLEIRKLCEEVQVRWSEADRVHRTITPSPPLTIPMAPSGFEDLGVALFSNDGPSGGSRRLGKGRRDS